LRVVKALGNDLFTGRVAELIDLTPADRQKAFVVFSTYRDQPWSFVDCTSLMAMQRLGINTAISLDKHFRQMPGVTVVS
jgi:predicted nucleic acid-binding protein